MTSEFGPGFGPDPEPDDRQPFGVNSAQVWIFLEELRELDLDRAVLVWDGYQIAQANGYPTALAAAEHVAERHRPAAWSRARQAAAMVARKRLGDLALTGEIIAVLADVAGSLVVRDMLPGRDFKLLQLPWTWHGEREPGLTAAEMGTAAGAVVVEPVAASSAVPMAAAAALPVASSAAASAAVPGAGGQPARRALPTFLSSKSVRFGARAFTVIATVTVLASLTRLTPDSGNVDTDSPGASSVAVLFPGPSSVASGGVVSPSGPASTGAPSAPGQTPAPQPPATQQPAPTPPPKPTPRPTPTPKPICTVISLLDVPTVKAQDKWTAAGFTGKVNFSPAIPPHYRIQWQSLAAGASVTCSHAITVSDHVP